ncbi:hypothetical protein [Burkholderia sp. BCC0397]|uniref:hypothetical protein n=1 Tax=Burkholderia sp. BCC0397 TaxID=486876 RepID=UPI0015893FC0|nr:hypothetical protein [Burkholderia sp. BCC0397]
MTDIHEQTIPPLKPAQSLRPLWVGILWALLGLPTLAFVGTLGFFTPYCGSLGGALFWALLWSAAIVMHDFVPYALNLWTVLAACAAVALVAWLLRRFKVTWRGFLVTLASVYFIAATVAWLIHAQGDCRLF